MNHILVTGATGKVGAHFVRHVLHSDLQKDIVIRALCHNRVPEPHSRLEIVKGNISDRDTVRQAMKGSTHVIHCATCKETADNVIDVTVKGLFWLLEECRASSAFQQFILVGGDAAVGHFFYPHFAPVTEQQKHSANPGCYALSKVIEEVMLEQYYIQYNLPGGCLRARRGSWRKMTSSTQFFRRSDSREKSKEHRLGRRRCTPYSEKERASRLGRRGHSHPSRTSCCSLC